LKVAIQTKGGLKGVIWKNKTALNGKTLYHPTFYHHWFKTLNQHLSTHN